jgi:hypothetical protein
MLHSRTFNRRIGSNPDLKQENYSENNDNIDTVNNVNEDPDIGMLFANDNIDEDSAEVDNVNIPIQKKSNPFNQDVFITNHNHPSNGWYAQGLKARYH